MIEATKRTLVSLCPKAIQGPSWRGRIPSLGQCLGQGKLLGEYYGMALCEMSHIENREVEEKLTCLSMIMRAYIVLDDFIKDNKVDPIVSRLLSVWISGVKEEGIRLTRTLSDSADRLWTKYLQIYEDAYRDYDYQNRYLSTMNKCSFLFLPFEMDVVINGVNSLGVERRAIEYYLFSLQFLDDFHDIEEDINAPRNHNLLVGNLSHDEQIILMSRRFLFSRWILSYVRENLVVASSSLSRKCIIWKFLDASIEWIDRYRSKLPMDASIELTEQCYERFLVTKDSSSKVVTRRGIECDSSVHIIDDIRAENMHSAFASMAQLAEV